MKPVLRDHGHERLPVFKDQIFQAGPTFQYSWTHHHSLQRANFYGPMGWSFKRDSTVFILFILLNHMTQCCPCTSIVHCLLVFTRYRLYHVALLHELSHNLCNQCTRYVIFSQDPFGFMHLYIVDLEKQEINFWPPTCSKICFCGQHVWLASVLYWSSQKHLQWSLWFQTSPPPPIQPAQYGLKLKVVLK